MMEAKMITIPFDVELAKKIQAGEHPGKIVTVGGNDAEIVYWDFKSMTNAPLLVITTYSSGNQIHGLRYENGKYVSNSTHMEDLSLQVPEWTQYKEGDVLATKHGSVLILRQIDDKRVCCYVGLFNNPWDKVKFGDSEIVCYVDGIKGYASESDKQKLIDALKESTNPLAKKYLKQFFGIGEAEKKPECEFEPFDKVLVRSSTKEKWQAAFFSYYDNERPFPYITTGSCAYLRCIPFNEKTKHLVGTTDNWEEE